MKALKVTASSELAVFNNVVFPSLPKESFRITCEPLNEDNRWNLWLENRRTRLQYELSVMYLKNHGPEGVPAPIVCYLLQKALAICEVSEGKKKEQEEDVQVDCAYSIEGITINLTLNMSKIWFPIYSFSMARKDVGDIEIIKSQLKDALEEIEKLKSEPKYEKKPAVLSLSSALVCTDQAIVKWSAPNNRIVNPAFFTINSDSSSVLILKKGFYQVCVRLAGISNTNKASPIILLSNGVILASCVHAEASNYQFSCHLNQIFELEAGAVLSVRSCFFSNSLGDPTQNTFNISLLQTYE